MTRDDALAALQRHQSAALSDLTAATDAMDGDRDAFLARQPAMRARMSAILGAYQAFKHDGVFDPGIASVDPERSADARAMKVACIAASETFRRHMSEWPPTRIAAEWPSYKAAARLTANQLRRHIQNEAEGVRGLIERYGV